MSQDQNNYTEHLLKMSEDLSEIRVQTAKNSVTLEQNAKDISEHIRRTNLLEQAQIRLDKRIDQVALPWKIAKWVVGGVFTAAGVIFSVIQVLQTAGILK